jgi:hypothetical protein
LCFLDEARDISQVRRSNLFDRIGGLRQVIAVACEYGTKLARLSVDLL